MVNDQRHHFCFGHRNRQFLLHVVLQEVKKAPKGLLVTVIERVLELRRTTEGISVHRLQNTDANRG